MSEWRVANALLKLRRQLNERFPNRRVVSDGTIGDVNHASRSSDHNPWVRDGSHGVVTGMDITNDPSHGLESEHLAETLREARDSRLKYVISNKKIASFDHQEFSWRPYGGTNPHNHHVHISVRPEKVHYDDSSPWNIDRLEPPKPLPDRPSIIRPLLVVGTGGPTVAELRKKLHLDPSRDVFDDTVREAVKKFQQDHGLTPDGKVGPYTWEKLDA